MKAIVRMLNFRMSYIMNHTEGGNMLLFSLWELGLSGFPKMWTLNFRSCFFI